VPRLMHPELTKGRAVSYLLYFYMDEPRFAADIQSIRDPYMPLIFDYALAISRLWIESKEILPENDYWRLVEYFQGKSQQMPEIPVKIERTMKRVQKTAGKLTGYEAALSELAAKWKLKTAWAGKVLLYYDISTAMNAMDILPSEMEAPLGYLDIIYPWPLPIAPLQIKVSAYDIILFGRTEVQRDIATKLEDYERRIRAIGMREAPSHLERHAKWWFEHFIHKETYDAIATMETNIKDGSQRVYGKTVSDAVRRFSKLIGIEP
jgi:hypothetical protein